MAELDVFLGTCACDFSPLLQTDKKNCFDKDVRRSSSILLNGHMLVECGPPSLHALEIAGRSAAEVTDVFLTHLHSDHFDTDKIARIAAAAVRRLRLWVREDAELPFIPNTDVVRMELGREYAAGEVKVTSLAANHTEYPQHFLFERNGKTLYYALDGAWICYDAFYALRGRKVDLLVLDCTVGDYDGDYRIAEHNSIPMVRTLLKSFATVAITGENSRVYLSHLAPSLHAPHERTESICSAFGAHVAYDGLELQV